MRLLIVTLAVLAGSMLLAFVWRAPLEAAANPEVTPNPAKAPWYFVGFQELQLHFHPLFAVVIIPLLAAGALILIPYLRYDNDTSGVWLLSHKGRRMGTVAAVTALVLTPTWIVLDEFWLDFAAWLPGAPPAISSGLAPFSVMLAGLVGFCAYLKKRFSASNNEAIQTVVVFLMVVFAVLTATGVWFRGPGMALVWPWSM